VTHDLWLKLLELTHNKAAVSLNELNALSKAVVDETFFGLVQDGLVGFSEGVLTMDSRQRVLLAERLIHGGLDPKKVSRFLGWQEFEDFAESILSENRFSTRKHFIFKSSAGRREIDILAWNQTFMFAVDCKHWVRGPPAGRMKDAAKAQVERVTDLAKRPELLHRLGIPNPDGRTIIPLILSLGDLRDRLIDGVPVVSVSRLLSFLYGVSPIDTNLMRVRLNSSSQMRLA